MSSGQAVVSQSYVIPQAPSIPSAPIFLPPQPIPHQAKAESQIVYAKIDTHAALTRPEQPRPVESYQVPRNEPTKAQPPSSESFKYEPLKPINAQPDFSYESWKQDYKPYAPEIKTSNSYYPEGNVLNVS